MFIKQRQTKKSSRFASRFAVSSGKRREYTASLYTTLAIQALLFFFLLVGAYRSLVVMRLKFAHVVWYAKFALPVVITLIAIVVLWAFMRGMRQVIESHRRPDKL